MIRLYLANGDLSLDEFERALDQGRLEIEAINGRWYKVRRNGQTKLWKKDPTRFRIPVKFAWDSHFAIETTNLDVMRMTDEHA